MSKYILSTLLIIFLGACSDSTFKKEVKNVEVVKAK